MDKEEMSDLILSNLFGDMVRLANGRRLGVMSAGHFHGNPDQRLLAAQRSRVAINSFVAGSDLLWKQQGMRQEVASRMGTRDPKEWPCVRAFAAHLHRTLPRDAEIHPEMLTPVEKVLGEMLNKPAQVIRQQQIAARAHDTYEILTSQANESGPTLEALAGGEYDPAELADMSPDHEEAERDGVQAAIRSVCEIFDDLTLGRPFSRSAAAEEECDKAVQDGIGIVKNAMLATRSKWEPEHTEASLFGDCLARRTRMYIDKTVHLFADGMENGRPMRIAGEALTELGIPQRHGDAQDMPAEGPRAVQLRELLTVFEYMAHSAFQGKVLYEAVVDYDKLHGRRLGTGSSDRMAAVNPAEPMNAAQYHLYRRRLRTGQREAEPMRSPNAEEYAAGVGRIEGVFEELIHQLAKAVNTADGWADGVALYKRFTLPRTMVIQ